LEQMMLSKKTILALTALVPLALAAPSFAAETAVLSPVAKPAATDSAAPAGKSVTGHEAPGAAKLDKATTKKATDNKAGSADKHGAIDQVWTTKAAQNDKPATKSVTGKSATDKSLTDKDAATKGNAAKSGSAGGAGSNSSVGVTGSASSHTTTTGAGLSPSMKGSANANSGAKTGTVTPDANSNPAGKP